MAGHPGDDKAEIEVICPQCGYHLARSVARLRRSTPVVCPNCGKELVEADNRRPPDAEP